MLVFTDGADNPGNFRMNNMSFMDVMRRAQEADVMVYAIGLEGRGTGVGGGGFGGMSQRPDPGLPAIAAETGGGYFELQKHTGPRRDIRARGRRASPAILDRLRTGEA